MPHVRRAPDNTQEPLLDLVRGRGEQVNMRVGDDVPVPGGFAVRQHQHTIFAGHRSHIGRNHVHRHDHDVTLPELPAAHRDHHLTAVVYFDASRAPPYAS
jgi:hypothetical protein